MKKYTKTISVLIPDGEIHVLMYVVNCLSLRKDIKVYAMSTKKNGYMKYSNVIEKYIYRPKTTTEEWIKHINREVEKYNIDLIMPIYEMGIKAIIAHREKINYPDRLCDLPNIVNFSLARNKGQLYLHLKAHKIPCPDSIIVKASKRFDLKKLNHDLVIKPVEDGGGGKGISVIKTEEDFLNYYKDYDYGCDAIAQEYIEGYDLCCNVLCKAGELIAYSIQKGTIFRDGAFTPQIGFDFIENEELLKIAKRLMKSLSWSGVANIDCRYDEKDKKIKVIEINTRFWLGTDAASIADVNFPYLYCLSSLNRKIKPLRPKLISYLSLEGLVRSVKKNPFFVFKFSYIYNHSPIRFIFKDPCPIFYKTIAVLTKRDA
jgi:predicted ATP-grasp superfamily ATP-dependent carboligase